MPNIMRARINDPFRLLSNIYEFRGLNSSKAGH